MTEETRAGLLARIGNLQTERMASFMQKVFDAHGPYGGPDCAASRLCKVCQVVFAEYAFWRGSVVQLRIPEFERVFEGWVTE